MRQADFIQRLLAAIIDIFLLNILLFLLEIQFPEYSHRWLFSKKAQPAPGIATYYELKNTTLAWVWIVYSIIMDCTSSQGTVGKQIMGIVVTDNDGHRITLLRSLMRNLFKYVSYAVAGLGFLYVLVDKKRRGWHDVVAKTLVLERK